VITIRVFRDVVGADNVLFDRVEASLARVLAKIPSQDREALDRQLRKAAEASGCTAALLVVTDTISSKHPAVLEINLAAKATDAELDRAIALELAGRTGGCLSVDRESVASRWGFEAVSQPAIGMAATIAEMMTQTESAPAPQPASAFVLELAKGF
jgi:hypothetical protein